MFGYLLNGIVFFSLIVEFVYVNNLCIDIYDVLMCFLYLV